MKSAKIGTLSVAVVVAAFIAVLLVSDGETGVAPLA